MVRARAMCTCVCVFVHTSSSMGLNLSPPRSAPACRNEPLARRHAPRAAQEEQAGTRKRHKEPQNSTVRAAWRALQCWGRAGRQRGAQWGCNDFAFHLHVGGLSRTHPQPPPLALRKGPKAVAPSQGRAQGQRQGPPAAPPAANGRSGCVVPSTAPPPPLPTRVAGRSLLPAWHSPPRR